MIDKLLRCSYWFSAMLPAFYHDLSMMDDHYLRHTCYLLRTFGLLEYIVYEIESFKANWVLLYMFNRHSEIKRVPLGNIFHNTFFKRWEETSLAYISELWWSKGQNTTLTLDWREWMVGRGLSAELLITAARLSVRACGFRVSKSQHYTSKVK